MGSMRDQTIQPSLCFIIFFDRAIMSSMSSRSPRSGQPISSPAGSPISRRNEARYRLSHETGPEV